MNLGLKETFLVKESLTDWDTGTWVHYSNVPQITINPKGMDIAGIYLFPERFIEDKGIQPYWTNKKYKFIVTLKSGTRILDFSQMTPKDLREFVKHMGTIGAYSWDETRNSIKKYGIKTIQEKMKTLIQQIKSNGAGGIGGYTTQKTLFLINRAFREMGYDALFDDSNVIYISDIETQLIVLNPNAIEIKDLSETKSHTYQGMMKVRNDLIDYVNKNFSDIVTMGINDTKPRIKYEEGRKKYIMYVSLLFKHVPEELIDISIIGYPDARDTIHNTVDAYAYLMDEYGNNPFESSGFKRYTKLLEYDPTTKKYDRVFNIAGHQMDVLKNTILQIAGTAVEKKEKEPALQESTDTQQHITSASLHDTEDFLDASMPVLIDFFGVSLHGQMKFNFVDNANQYVNYYKGTTDIEYSIENQIEVYEEATAFYDELTNQIVIPAFKRAGTDSFEPVDTITSSKEVLVHESIHFVQYNTGGYSESYLFDEGVTELLSYVLCGEIDSNNAHDYFLYVKSIIVLLASNGIEGKEIINWCKAYTIADNKTEMYELLLTNCIQALHLDTNVDELHSQLENEAYEFNVSDDDIKTILFGLFEEYRIV